MNQLLSKIKMANKDAKPQFNKTCLWVEIAMVVMGVFLLAIDLEQFVTISVFLIFFAFIFSMVTLFRFLMSSSLHRQVKMKHSVHYAYQKYIQDYNEKHDKSYQFKTDIDLDQNWLLTPSFSNKQIEYCLQNDGGSTRMYHGEAYNIVGEKQTKTYYFKGLYIIMEDQEGEGQYRDKSSLSKKIIQSLKGIYAKDENDVNHYPFESPYKTGSYYGQTSKNIPEVFKRLLSTVKSYNFVSNVKIILKNNQLHMAIEESKNRLPYVNKYSVEELENIKAIVNENASLLDDIVTQIRKQTIDG
ncbi:MAG TPA: hypothetical protein VJ878_02390 [Candidatus Izemoplasmatales bacterium]|nr:hypothetical protein [Candidatus Izemoplasmatales bacterium]